MNDGFADLRTPTDLFRKLEHDRARMEADPSDSYAAFDFFVTAEHLLDWLLPGPSKEKDRKERRKAEEFLKITSHLANGAKHFHKLKPHHVSVRHTDIFEGGFDAHSFSPDSFSPSSFELGGLHVELEDGTLLHAYSLADQVLTYWRRELGL